MLQPSKRTQNIVEYCIPFVRRTDVFRIFEPLRASTWQSEEQTYYGTPLYFTCPCLTHYVLLQQYPINPPASIFRLLHYSTCFNIQPASYSACSSLFHLLQYSTCFTIPPASLFHLLHYSTCFNIPPASQLSLFQYSACFNLPPAS
uniref:Ovule protein n=1 Tax=Meloidogyne hapla TaxID=6305 RepID=A0A1I8BM10_MELHA